jgi:NADPH-dependent glutamate synthase beta subunit-like oxidoreductase
MGVANENAEGVIDGTDFLQKVNVGEQVPTGDKVVIVGGGNVAIDCARTCVRLGFKDVNIAYRRSRDEMPAIDEEIAEAEKEGVKINLLAGLSRVVVDGGRVTGMEFIKNKLGEPDESGRRRPEPVAGSEFVIDTGLIISSIGEEPDLQLLTGDFSKAVSGGLIAADPVTLQTNIEGIFAGGDAVSGPDTVIGALAAGKKAAISIDRYLKGEPLDTGREGEEVYESKLTVDTFGVGLAGRLDMPALPVEQRQGNFKEVELGLSKEDAVREAERCLSCDCRICINLLGCPAIITDNGNVVIDSTQCPGCGVCAQVCPHDAIISGEKNV